ncbi:MAG: hypothetical protein P4L95_11830 [Rouxiella aceris]|uniref:hypothetical protein n=1 Tax=Rouxiella aceris TaxID=2703884 RepID=UPI002846375F|nr:hypothetical protein [Rouxiella aceris]MDR3432572.1 hypothetical protein [Rouxiella aceris]
MSNFSEKPIVLGFIQDIITRLSQNSFLVKGWSASIVAVVGALLEKNAYTLNMTYVVCISIFIFWFLNAMYLYHERAFRHLYNEKATTTAFHDKYFLLNVNDVKGCCCKKIWSFTKSFLSLTVLPFHGALLVVAIYVLPIK